LVRSVRVLIYDTSHYLPIAGPEITELAEILHKNNLPRMNLMMYGVFKMLSHREKQDQAFKDHDLQLLVQTISGKQEQFSTESSQFNKYLQNLGVDKIVCPLRNVTEYIEDDLIATDPKFMGDILSALERLDYEHKKITNTPVTGKLPLLKLALILGLVLVIVGVGYYAYSSGALSGLIPHFGSFGGPQPSTTNGIMQKYPTPQALKQAIKDGKVDYNSLPADVKKMVDNTQLPATPLPSDGH
jgi:hypothetical protein